MDRSYLPEGDARFLALALGRYTRLPADRRLSSVDDWLDGADDKEPIQARVDALYAGSQLHDTDERLRWFEADETAINDSSDTMLALARALQPQLEELNEEDKAFSGTLSSLRPRYMQAIIDWKNDRSEPVYPDANSTLRVTYGTVQGVSPRTPLPWRRSPQSPAFWKKTPARSRLIHPRQNLNPSAPAATSTATHPGSRAHCRSTSWPTSTSPAATPAHRRSIPKAASSAWPSTATGSRSAETGSTNSPSTAPFRSTCATCCGSCTTWIKPITCCVKWAWKYRPRRNQHKNGALHTSCKGKTHRPEGNLRAVFDLSGIIGLKKANEPISVMKTEKNSSQP